MECFALHRFQKKQPVLVYWDANALASEHATGIVVYGANLLRALQKYDDLEFIGLLKLSRLKRRHFIKRHADLRIKTYIPPFSDWCLSRKAVYHGIDFKVPNTRRLPRVVTIHDLSVFESGLSDPRFQQRGIEYNTWLINKVNPERIIVPTQAVRDHVLQHFPETAKKLRVIPHGAEQAFAATADANEIPQKIRQLGPFILCPGSVEKRKNGATLIEAFERSAAADTLHLVFAGGMGYDAETIRKRADASPARNRIHFVSGISSAALNALYRTAVFTVYPSLFEGFGLPIVEAFALESPLITSNFGAMAEVASDAALTVDTRSAEALGAAIDRLASDTALRADFQQRGKKRALDFSWKKAAAATRDVYLELAAK